MSNSCPPRFAQAHIDASCRRGSRDTVALLVGLLALSRVGQAIADERFVLPVERQTPDFDLSYARPAVVLPPFRLPDTYQAMGVPDATTFSADEFRPRGQSISEQRTQASSSNDAPMLRNTTVWQRLRDFRSHGRVQLLTLWETSGSSVSLQAGKRGEPSLQWTSRVMNRGGATRGLFDQLFSVSVAGASRGMHLTPRQGTVESAAKPAKLADTVARR